MLVVEVDPVSAQAVSDSSTTFLMWSGRLSGPPDPSMSKPNFVAMATWSRNGASASPTRVSLV